MSTDFLERLHNTNDILLHYAPMHTLLTEWGKALEDHLSQWIVDHPDAFQDALVKSFAAGCDLASTSTQAAVRWRANVFGLGHKIHEFNYVSAKLAREVTPKDRYLCGFVCTSNPDFLEPVGNVSYAEAYDAYKEQTEALLEGDVDIILVSGNHLDESVIAIRVAKELADIPVIAHNVFYIGKRGYRTLMGHDPQTATALAKEAGADVVGASCGLMKDGATLIGHTDYYVGATQLVKEMRQGYDSFLAIQPNAGIPQLVDGHTVHPATPEEMAAEVGNWIDAGARIVGGCCGTGLEHYKRIFPVVRALNANNRGEVHAGR